MLSYHFFVSSHKKQLQRPNAMNRPCCLSTRKLTVVSYLILLLLFAVDGVFVFGGKQQRDTENGDDTTSIQSGIITTQSKRYSKKGDHIPIMDITKRQPTSTTSKSSSVTTKKQRKELAKFIREKIPHEELQIVICDNIAYGYTPKEMATHLYNEWNIGGDDKTNTESSRGLLLLIVMEQNRLELEFGDGLSHLLNAEWCQEMLITKVVPNFRNEEYVKGIQEAIVAISNRFRIATYRSSRRSDNKNLEQQTTKGKWRWRRRLGGIAAGLFGFERYHEYRKNKNRGKSDNDGDDYYYDDNYHYFDQPPPEYLYYSRRRKRSQRRANADGRFRNRNGNFYFGAPPPQNGFFNGFGRLLHGFSSSRRRSRHNHPKTAGSTTTNVVYVMPPRPSSSASSNENYYHQQQTTAAAQEKPALFNPISNNEREAGVPLRPEGSATTQPKTQPFRPASTTQENRSNPRNPQQNQQQQPRYHRPTAVQDSIHAAALNALDQKEHKKDQHTKDPATKKENPRSSGLGGGASWSPTSATTTSSTTTDNRDEASSSSHNAGASWSTNTNSIPNRSSTPTKRSNQSGNKNKMTNNNNGGGASGKGGGASW